MPEAKICTGYVSVDLSMLETQLGMHASTSKEREGWGPWKYMRFASERA